MQLRSFTAAAAGASLFLVATVGSLDAATAQRSAGATVAQRTNVTLGLARSVLTRPEIAAGSGQEVVVRLDVPGAPALTLTPHSVRAENFEVRAQLEDGSWIIMPEEPVRTYRGSVVGDPGSVVAASVLEDGLHARILTSAGSEYWVEPISGRVDGASPDQHVFYRGEDVAHSAGSCDADLIAPIVSPDMHGASLEQPGTTYAGTGAVTAEIACDADYEYFSTHGSGTQAQIESVINGLNVQYVRDVGITHQITTILIRTSSNDPYTRKGASQLLGQFRNEWNSNQSGIQRDVAHLFTGRNLSGSTIGIAYVGTVCNLSVAYGLVESDFAGNNMACITDLSAHELGHNWGASHCSCSSFTMNAGITCANQFSPSATIPVITSFRNAQTCFGPPPTTGSISGTVTSSAGGAPIGGATVQTDTGQSGTTAGNGTYSISGVPTGNRTVTASAPGFDSANQNANVTENNDTVVNFSLDPAPVGSQAVVECITYSSTGGQNQDRNLFIEVLIEDDAGNPVEGASVSVDVDLDGAPFGTATATTGADGTVTFQAKNSPNGCFSTDVTNVSATGLSFDGTEPTPNGFDKGTQASPDPDCRGSSDGC